MAETNKKVRQTAKERGVFLWEIALKWPLSEANFSRKLHKEFTAAEKEKALSLINEIAAEHKGRG